MKVYNKLVRDKIPDIILKDNELPVTRILDDEEFIKELNKKLQEEVNEYLEGENVEEMVDILEVIRAILEYKSSKISKFLNPNKSFLFGTLNNTSKSL